MDALQRTKVGLIRRPPADWRQVLTYDPTRPKQWISTLGALVAASFLLVVLFSVAVVVIQPFLLLFHTTPYPNLATVSFNTFLIAGSLCLLSFSYLTIRLFRYWLLRWFPGDIVIIVWRGFFYYLNLCIKILAGLFFAAIVGYVLLKVSQDALAWLKFGDKLVYIYRQFFEIFFKFLDWIGLTAIIPS